ncbi:hypothetical protein GCM10028801_06830 [Nocardioides maradonensis]
MNAILYLAGALLFGYVIHEAHRHDRHEMTQKFRTRIDGLLAMHSDLHARLRQEREDHAATRIELAVAQGERDIHATALRAKLEQEARAELIHPDQPVGEARVYHLKAVR